MPATTYYFEDYHIRQRLISPACTVDAEELIAYARKWDPQPFHVDETAAQGSVYGSLIAPSSYTMAVSNLLGSRIEPKPAALGALGWQDVEFPNPVHPRDRLTVTIEIVELRQSNSKPDRGVIRSTVRMANQRDETVLAYQLTVLVAKRGDRPA